MKELLEAVRAFTDMCRSIEAVHKKQLELMDQPPHCVPVPVVISATEYSDTDTVTYPAAGVTWWQGGGRQQ